MPSTFVPPKAKGGKKDDGKRGEGRKGDGKKGDGKKDEGIMASSPKGGGHKGGTAKGKNKHFYYASDRGTAPQGLYLNVLDFATRRQDPGAMRSAFESPPGYHGKENRKGPDDYIPIEPAPYKGKGRGRSRSRSRERGRGDSRDSRTASSSRDHYDVRSDRGGGRFQRRSRSRSHRYTRDDRHDSRGHRPRRDEGEGNYASPGWGLKGKEGLPKGDYEPRQHGPLKRGGDPWPEQRPRPPQDPGPDQDYYFTEQAAQEFQQWYPMD